MNQFRYLLVNEQIIKLATDYLGLSEIAGSSDNPIIVRMFNDIGHSWVKDDETAWCSCFMNWIAWKLKLERSNKLNARSWLTVGEETFDPIPGDVTVLWRESANSWKGHVGIFMGFDKDMRINMLGGNQNNEVNITAKPLYRLLGYRRLRKLN